MERPSHSHIRGKLDESRAWNPVDVHRLSLAHYRDVTRKPTVGDKLFEHPMATPRDIRLLRSSPRIRKKLGPNSVSSRFVIFFDIPYRLQSIEYGGSRTSSGK